MSSGKDTIAGLGLVIMVGAVMGLAIGMLYAPRPGEETREILKEKTGEFKHKAVDAIAQGKEKAIEVIHKGEEKLLRSTKPRAWEQAKSVSSLAPWPGGQATAIAN
jgi:gas vesicle protein